jgi:hypothetical protein
MLMKVKSAMQGRPEAQSYDERSKHQIAEVGIADVTEEDERSEECGRSRTFLKKKGEVKDEIEE